MTDAAALDHPDLSPADARTGVAHLLGPYLNDLRQLSLAHRLRDVAVFVGLWGVGLALAAASGVVENPWPLRLAALGASALALNAFVLLLHEGMHGVLFQNRAANRCASVLFGAAVGMSFTGYRRLHTLHHDHLGTDDDPDDYHAYTRSPLAFWLLQGLRLAVGAAVYVFAIPILAARRGTAEDRRHMAQEYVVLVALWAAALWLVPSAVLLWGWLLPLPVVAALVQIRGLTQHGLTERHDPLLASRTVRPHPVVAFFLLNENLHLEHHLFPEVPSYHLPALHEAIWDRLPRACEGTSYLGFLGRFARQSVALDETPVGIVAPASAAGA